jgi:oxygen-independent coproporphyrinogen-3 oxidase
VPWIKPGQRGYDEKDLPSKYLKRHLYELGRHKLKQAYYADIGMDHFSLPKDDLFKASVAGTLHRNFMGYTTSQTDLLIGLGASAISDSGYAYAQNEKVVEDYTTSLINNSHAIAKGHMLSSEDRLIRACILQISCHGRLSAELLRQVQGPDVADRLDAMEKEGLLYVNNDGLTVRSLGEPFIRNICQAFDKRGKVNSSEAMYSKAI